MAHAQYGVPGARSARRIRQIHDLMSACIGAEVIARPALASLLALLVGVPGYAALGCAGVSVCLSLRGRPVEGTMPLFFGCSGLLLGSLPEMMVLAVTHRLMDDLLDAVLRVLHREALREESCEAAEVFGSLIRGATS